MSVLKVTEVKSEEVAKKDEVVAGQVRMTADGKFTVLIVNAHHIRVLIREAKSPNEKFLAAILNSPNDFGIGNEFMIDEKEHLSSVEDISRRFPILLDAELTYKEAK